MALGLLPWPTWSREVEVQLGQLYHFEPMAKMGTAKEVLL